MSFAHATPVPRQESEALYEDAEDLLRDGRGLVQRLVRLADGGVDLGDVAAWERRVARYFGE